MSTVRQIILDTETTGLNADEGHRIIEIGCVELVDRRPSGRTLHLYLNPERDIDEGALAVHGLSLDRLRDEPVFAQVAERIVDFVAGAEVLIHNAPFDLAFLDAELGRLGMRTFTQWAAAVTDTLTLARQLHPGRRNTLDALCERYGVANSHRTFHGALLDAQLLADVYLAMTRGQDSLEMSVVTAPEVTPSAGESVDTEWPPVGLAILSASEDEIREHEALLSDMARESKRAALWEELAQGAATPAGA
jgi:DNA polymerase III subunit epsilon